MPTASNGSRPQSQAHATDPQSESLRQPAHVAHGDELARVREADQHAKPRGWVLSPQAVRSFILGDRSLDIAPKFFGDTSLVERCIVTLMSERALLLVGRPGTAKSMLSELLSVAISGTAEHTIQGTAGTTQDHLSYGWNYAMLINEGPSRQALVASPLYEAMTLGHICRFEEITRVQPEVSDSLIGLLSDKVIRIPELTDLTARAKRGFNLIATANLKDRGVHELSSALKRRFNFETVHPLADRALERDLIVNHVTTHMNQLGIESTPALDVIELLVEIFHDLRSGKTSSGKPVDVPATPMSTAEAVSVAIASSLDAHYFGSGTVAPRHITQQLIGTVFKDNTDDRNKLVHYFDTVVKERAEQDSAGGLWQQLLAERPRLDPW